MKRRTLIKVTLAAAPFALPILSAQQPSGEKPKRAVRVKPGEDRFNEPYKLNVGHMECKVSAQDTNGAIAIFEALTARQIVQ